MPSLEQIIRPFVVDPTTPPVPYITTLNEPPPDPVRLNIGIGGRSLKNLSPILPPSASDALKSATATIQHKTLSSSLSLSGSWYMTGVVREKAGEAPQTDFGDTGDIVGDGSFDESSLGDQNLELSGPGTMGSGSEAPGPGFEGGRAPEPDIPDAAPAGNPPPPDASGGPVGGSGGDVSAPGAFP